MLFSYLKKIFTCIIIIITLYDQTKTPISFWCRWRLTHGSFIQLLKTLPVDMSKNIQVNLIKIKIIKLCMVYIKCNLI